MCISTKLGFGPLQLLEHHQVGAGFRLDLPASDDETAGRPSIHRDLALDPFVEPSQSK